MRVTATARRSQGWWAIEVTGAQGGPFHTQTRRLDQVEAMVKDGIALMADVPEDTIVVDVMPLLSEEDAALVNAVHAASQEAGRSAELASRLSRQTVEQLRSEGMTVRDVGRLLGVSPQRVSQLIETGAGHVRASTDQAEAS